MRRCVTEFLVWSKDHLQPLHLALLFKGQIFDLKIQRRRYAGLIAPCFEYVLCKVDSVKDYADRAIRCSALLFGNHIILKEHTPVVRWSLSSAAQHNTAKVSFGSWRFCWSRGFSQLRVLKMLQHCRTSSIPDRCWSAGAVSRPRAASRSRLCTKLVRSPSKESVSTPLFSVSMSCRRRWQLQSANRPSLLVNLCHFIQSWILFCCSCCFCNRKSVYMVSSSIIFKNNSWISQVPTCSRWSWSPQD